MPDMSNTSPIIPKGVQSPTLANSKAAEIKKGLEKIPSPSQETLKQAMNLGANIYLLHMRKSMLEAGIQPQKVPYHPLSATRPTDPAAPFFDSSDYMRLWLEANGIASSSYAVSGSQAADEVSGLAQCLSTEVSLSSQIYHEMTLDDDRIEQLQAKSSSIANGFGIAGEVLAAIGLVVLVVGVIAASSALTIMSGGAAAPVLIPATVSCVIALIGLISAVIGGLVATASNATQGAYMSQSIADPNDPSQTTTLAQLMEDAAIMQGGISGLEAEISASKNSMQLTQTQYDLWSSSLQSTLELMGATFDTLKQMSQAV